MFKSLNNKTYIVGGFVRDELLGLQSEDRDFVIEATEEEFMKVFPDAKKVGESFPVFLHPETGEEIALTRTERCTGNGEYTKYEVTGVGVPIEEDLYRRDFTINSIAKHFVTGKILDPTNGTKDLKDGVLRCVNSEAFNDDPLRIYRGLRFASKLNFKIDLFTYYLMFNNTTKLNKIEKERVVIELKKVYAQCKQPSTFFKELNSLFALQYHFSPLYDLTLVPAGPSAYHGTNTGFDHTMEAIDRCKQADLNFDCFIAVLFHDTGKAKTPADILPHHYRHELRSYDINRNFFNENRFEAKTVDLALVVGKYHMKSHYITIMGKVKLIRFFRSIRRLEEFLACCQCDHPFKGDEMKYYEIFKQVKENTIIDIPKGHGDPNNFVNTLYAKEFNRILNEKI